MYSGQMDKDLYDLITSSKMATGNNYGTGVIIYDPTENAILMGVRSDTHDWATPGGKVEIGESPLQGVMRECKEECGLTMKDAQFIGYEMHTAPNGKNWTSFMFLCTDYSGTVTPQLSEFENMIWVPLFEAMNLNIFPPTQKALELAIEKHALSTDFSYAVEDKNNGEADGYQPVLPVMGELPVLSDVKSRSTDMCHCCYSDNCDDEWPMSEPYGSDYPFPWD